MFIFIYKGSILLEKQSDPYGRSTCSIIGGSTCDESGPRSVPGLT